MIKKSSTKKVVRVRKVKGKGIEVVMVYNKKDVYHALWAARSTMGSISEPEKRKIVDSLVKLAYAAAYPKG